MFLASLLLSTVLAASSTNIRVETNVGGGKATVDTRIESTINGETKVVESHEPGVIEVKGDDKSGFEVKQEPAVTGVEEEQGEVEVNEGGDEIVVKGVSEEGEGQGTKGGIEQVKGWVEEVVGKMRLWWEQWKEKLSL